MRENADPMFNLN